MTAPMFPVSFTGDGATTVFNLGFDYLDVNDIRVIKNGALMVRGTDYAVVTKNRDSGFDSIRFLAAPTNGHAIKFYRNTSIALRKPALEIGHLVALQALYREQERNDQRRTLKGYINGTDLAAGTAKSFVAPCDGYIELLRSQVVDAAVGTGGAITVEIDGVAVTGLSVTIANSAAIGTVQEDTPTTAQSATTAVRKGQTITVTPAAAFATSGAVIAEVELQPADL